MMYVKLAVFLAVCFTASAQQEKVNVTLYYESLSSNSENYIAAEVFRGIRKVGDYVNLDLVPFGMAKVDEATKAVTCANGPNECYGNKVHACAIAKNPRDKWLAFINCLSRARKSYDNVINEQCATKSNASWTEIKACVDGEESNQLILNNAEKTKQGGVTYVPHVVVNGVANFTLERQIRLNFIGAVCSLLTEKPQVCNDDN